jgi:hypothetical protein
MNNVGIWIPVMDDSGTAPYSLSQVSDWITENCLTPTVHDVLRRALAELQDRWIVHLRYDYGATRITDSLRVFFEPVNDRLFEVRAFSTLDAAEAYPIETVHRYVGMDVYARARTGLVYGVGMIETRVETRDIAPAPRELSGQRMELFV